MVHRISDIQAQIGEKVRSAWLVAYKDGMKTKRKQVEFTVLQEMPQEARKSFEDDLCHLQQAGMIIFVFASILLVIACQRAKLWHFLLRYASSDLLGLLPWLINGR